MSENEQIVTIEDSEKLSFRLWKLGNILKPIDDENVNYFFFEVIRELIDAALTNYGHLKRAYLESKSSTGIYPYLAWASRNLLELSIFTKYVLTSASNSRRFGEDRLVDGCEIIKSLIDLEHFYDPQCKTDLLDEALSRMEAQMVVEGVKAKKHIDIKQIVEAVEMKEEYKCMNRFCSKLVHPSAWSVLAMNKGTNSFAQSRDILFGTGVGYLSEIYLAVESHNDRQQMRPNP